MTFLIIGESYLFLLPSETVSGLTVVDIWWLPPPAVVVTSSSSATTTKLSPRGLGWMTGLPLPPFSFSAEKPTYSHPRRCGRLSEDRRDSVYRPFPPRNITP